MLRCETLPTLGFSEHCMKSVKQQSLFRNKQNCVTVVWDETVIEPAIIVRSVWSVANVSFSLGLIVIWKIAKGLNKYCKYQTSKSFKVQLTWRTK